MYLSEGVLKQMEKYNVASLQGFDPCITYIGTGFIEYIKTITEVLHDLDLKTDMNSAECLHLPISFLWAVGYVWEVRQKAFWTCSPHLLFPHVR